MGGVMTPGRTMTIGEWTILTRARAKAKARVTKEMQEDQVLDHQGEKECQASLEKKDYPVSQEKMVQ